MKKRRGKKFRSGVVFSKALRSKRPKVKTSAKVYRRKHEAQEET